MVIGCFSQKGGAGKSTIATHCAVIAAEQYSVVLADADPQHNTTDWHAERQFSTPLDAQITPSNARELIAAAREGGVDFVIVDFPPHASAGVADLVSHMDFVIVPCQPTPPDYLTLPATVAILHAHKKPFAFVLNRIDRQAKKRREAAEEVLASFGEVCPHAVAQLNAYADSWAHSLAVTEFAPGTQAADDMRAIWQWVEARVAQGVAA
jgi:chromosome partitioning protein